jgi:hypothetical protein
MLSYGWFDVWMIWKWKLQSPQIIGCISDSSRIVILVVAVLFDVMILKPT